MPQAQRVANPYSVYSQYQGASTIPRRYPLATQPAQSPESLMQREAQSQVTSRYLQPRNFGPQPYPTTSPSMFAPRVLPETGGRQTAARQAAYETQKGLAGPLGNILPGAPNRPLTRGDIPLLEAGLNYEQILMAEQDRERAFQELARARSAVGYGPGAEESRNLALQFSREGPFSQNLMDENVSRIRQGAGLGIDAARRAAASQLGERGLGGSSIAAFRLAELEQDGRQQSAQDVTSFLNQATLANREAQQQAQAGLQQITGREETQRAAIDQLLAELFGQTERGPISLAGLIPAIPRGQKFRPRTIV